MHFADPRMPGHSPVAIDSDGAPAAAAIAPLESEIAELAIRVQRLCILVGSIGVVSFAACLFTSLWGVGPIIAVGAAMSVFNRLASAAALLHGRSVLCCCCRSPRHQLVATRFVLAGAAGASVVNCVFAVLSAINSRMSGIGGVIAAGAALTALLVAVFAVVLAVQMRRVIAIHDELSITAADATLRALRIIGAAAGVAGGGVGVAPLVAPIAVGVPLGFHGAAVPPDGTPVPTPPPRPCRGGALGPPPAAYTQPPAAYLVAEIDASCPPPAPGSPGQGGGAAAAAAALSVDDGVVDGAPVIGLAMKAIATASSSPAPGDGAGDTPGEAPAQANGAAGPLEPAGSSAAAGTTGEGPAESPGVTLTVEGDGSPVPSTEAGSPAAAFRPPGSGSAV